MALSSELQGVLASRHRSRKTDATASIGRTDESASRLCSESDQAVPALALALDPHTVVQIPTSLPCEMPSSFWTSLLFGKPDDAVSSENARLALALIEVRLGEYQDSGQSIKRDPGANAEAVESLAATVGSLHDQIYELYDSHGWFAFQQLYHEAAGLHPRRKKIAYVDAVTATYAQPVNCDAIEPGLVLAINQMPTKLQRWMLAPPRWQTNSPPDGMDDGSWCG